MLHALVSGSNAVVEYSPEDRIPPDALVFFLFLTTTVCLSLTLLVLNTLFGYPLWQLDLLVFDTLNHVAINQNSRRLTWLARAAADITALGSYTVVSLVTLATSGFLFIRRRMYQGLWILLGTCGGVLVSNALKAVLGKARPDPMYHLVEVASSSFPSGHALVSAAVYLSIGAVVAGIAPTRSSKAYVASLAVFVTVVVGASRVYLGVHYPSDVLGGWALGTTWALLCWFGVAALASRCTVSTQPLVSGEPCR